MTRKLLDDLGRLQRAVMEVVWDLGEASVHDVRDRLGRGKRLAYTTVLSSMQKLEKAGWLTHRNEGKSYIYTPTKTRQQAGSRSVRKFVDRMFDGSTVLMFQHLIRETNLTDADLTKLRKMIDQKRKEAKR